MRHAFEQRRGGEVTGGARAPRGRWATLSVMGLALLAVLGAGRAGATEVVAAAGVCAACHPAEAAETAASGGHAATLDCVSCHANARPDRVGPGHRTIARCAGCHALEGHPPRRRPRRGRRAQRNCLTCHTPHGSPNLALVRPQVRHRRRLLPIELSNESGAAPGGFTNPVAAGTGLCEACHRRTEFYRRDGAGAEHFDAPCTACHRHEVGFEPVVSDENCAICHSAQGTRFARPSGHSASLACSDCHDDGGAPIGPGHRRTADCGDCHATPTHMPAGRTALACVACHEPHGTENRTLIADAIQVPQGGTRPVVFTSISGREDGGFASASAPGTGLCEVCHTTTAYYRADGTGGPHYTLSCLPCHTHQAGFLPP